MTSRESKSIVFNSDRCIGCYSCVVSCMDQNDLDVARDDLSWRIVENVPGRLVGKHRGNASVSIACMHCEDAVCIAACPAGAITRDAATGSVLVDDGLCIGCHACAMACPFGAPRFGSSGKMQKCDGCYARTQFGLEPACVRNCPTHALAYEPVNASMDEKAASAARKLV